MSRRSCPSTLAQDGVVEVLVTRRQLEPARPDDRPMARELLEREVDALLVQAPERVFDPRSRTSAATSRARLRRAGAAPGTGWRAARRPPARAVRGMCARGRAAAPRAAPDTPPAKTRGRGNARGRRRRSGSGGPQSAASASSSTIAQDSDEKRSRTDVPGLIDGPTGPRTRSSPRLRRRRRGPSRCRERRASRPCRATHRLRRPRSGSGRWRRAPGARRPVPASRSATRSANGRAAALAECARPRARLRRCPRRSPR